MGLTVTTKTCPFPLLDQIRGHQLIHLPVCLQQTLPTRRPWWKNPWTWTLLLLPLSIQVKFTVPLLSSTTSSPVPPHLDQFNSCAPMTEPLGEWRCPGSGSIWQPCRHMGYKTIPLPAGCSVKMESNLGCKRSWSWIKIWVGPLPNKPNHFLRNSRLSMSWLNMISWRLWSYLKLKKIELALQHEKTLLAALKLPVYLMHASVFLWCQKWLARSREYIYMIKTAIYLHLIWKLASWKRRLGLFMFRQKWWPLAFYWNYSYRLDTAKANQGASAF